MSKPNYRVIVTFDGERKLFVARAPELEHCTAEGATRAEAIAKAEEEIDAQLANMLSHGSTPPKAVDEEVFSGDVTAKIGKGLHRDLAYQARTEGIELEQLVSELLSASLESRKQTRQRGGNRHQAESVPHDNIGNRHDGGPPRDRNRGFGGRGYAPQILDDRANFIEYVRGLENSGGNSGGGFQRGGGGGGGGNNGPRDDRGGRRRRGRGGGGGGGGGGGQRPHGQFQQNRSNGNGQPQHAAPPSAAPQGAPPSAPPAGSNGPNDGGDGNV